MSLLPAFWEWIRGEFAYVADSPSVAGLLRRLFITELFRQADAAPIDSLAQHELQEAGRANAVVFLTQWRDSSAMAGSYAAAAAALAEEQNVRAPLASMDLEAIRSVYTFWDAEKRVVSSLKEWLLAEIVASTPVDAEYVAALVSERKAGHWLSGAGRDADDRRAVAAAYDAILALCVNIRETPRPWSLV